MRSTVIAVLATMVVSVAGATQDVIHYKFESRGAATVVNYAAGSGLASALASFTRAPTWDDGKFGGGYRGYTTSAPSLVATGWDGGFSGAITVAAFVRVRQVTSGGFEFIRGAGSSGYFSAGLDAISRGGGFFVRLGSRNWYSTTDAHSRASSGWVHVAFVADPSTRIGQFYVDGQPEPPIQMPSSISVDPSLQGVMVGSSTGGSVDFDEVRVRLGIASGVEIRQWATVDSAADGAYGVGCFPQHQPVTVASNSAQAGAPAIGNENYAIALYALPGSAFQLAVGTSRTNFGPVTLPMDLSGVDPSLNGCLWYVSSDVGLIPGVVPVTGVQAIPAAIPGAAGLVGLDLHLQAFLRSGALQRYMTSNAFVVSIGR